MKEPLKTVSLQTLGCRLNQYDTEKMAAALYPYGFRRVEPGEKADLYIINTCTVTHKADSDCRQMVKRAIRQNPDGRVVVAGCYVDSDTTLASRLGGVHALIKNADKSRIADILPAQLPDLFDRQPDAGCSTHITDFHGHNRAWVKVSDGCNQWCSFCIIPTVRGRLSNRPALEVIDEINALANAGYFEVVLTGVHLGHYKNRLVEPQMKNLAALCRLILDVTNLHRLRLSSVEPQSIREDLIRLYAESDGRICRHWHVPLQSASSRILKRMLRPYDQNTYINRVTALRNTQPNTIIGADVIVGFPGETDDDFNQTRRLANSGLIDYLHVFSYSDRPGTPASKMPDKVAPEIIKERNRILTEISDTQLARACARQVGETLEVIAEHRKDGRGVLYGVADNYVKVKLPDDCEGGRMPLSVQILSVQKDFVEGPIVTRAAS